MVDFRDYYCRKCGVWLFKAEPTRTRLQTICPDRRCRVAQMVFLDRPAVKPRRLTLVPVKSTG